MPKYSVSEVLEIIKSLTAEEKRELQQQLPNVLDTAATPSGRDRSQSMSGISISGSRGVDMSQIQADEASSVVSSKTQATIQNTDLQAALELLKQQTNLILLLGASGSGKSSVVRAGLIPRLAKKFGLQQFVHFMFTPDRDPFESLYASLRNRYNQAEAEIARAAKVDTLTQTIKTLKQSGTYWFILIDQFEELFTTSEPDKCNLFIRSLVHLAKELDRDQEHSVKIMATMRADFLDRFSPYPSLVRATRKHCPFIAEMQPDELRLAIEQPAALHGVVFEPGLVEEIIKEVQGRAGYLPLLQYTLKLLWEEEVQSGSIYNQTLNIITYRDLGGVRGALQKRIDEIYKALSDEKRLTVKRIFLKLVGIGEDVKSDTDWKPVRRRAFRSEFSDPLEKKVLTQLIDQNLLVSDRRSEFQEATVEIAHEILLTSWTTLNTWIKDNRQAIALRNRLNDDARRWQVGNKDERELWDGSKLKDILDLKKDSTFNQVLGLTFHGIFFGSQAIAFLAILQA